MMNIPNNDTITLNNYWSSYKFHLTGRFNANGTPFIIRITPNPNSYSSGAIELFSRYAFIVLLLEVTPGHITSFRNQEILCSENIPSKPYEFIKSQEPDEYVDIKVKFEWDTVALFGLINGPLTITKENWYD